MRKTAKSTAARDSDVESQLYADIAAITIDEVRRLRATSSRTPLSKEEAISLFTYARIYAILKDDLRADVKAGINNEPPTSATEN